MIILSLLLATRIPTLFSYYTSSPVFFELLRGWGEMLVGLKMHLCWLVSVFDESPRGHRLSAYPGKKHQHPVVWDISIREMVLLFRVNSYSTSMSLHKQHIDDGWLCYCCVLALRWSWYWRNMQHRPIRLHGHRTPASRRIPCHASIDPSLIPLPSERCPCSPTLQVVSPPWRYLSRCSSNLCRLCCAESMRWSISSAVVRWQYRVLVSTRARGLSLWRLFTCLNAVFSTVVRRPSSCISPRSRFHMRINTGYNNNC